MEDLKAPIMCTCYHTNYLTAGCWSPSRPGVFFTTKDSGELDIWDYAFKQHEPTLPDIAVSDAALQSIRVTQDGQVAVGAADGSTTILEISESLHEVQKTEKQTISAMLEREMKAKAKKAAAMAKDKGNEDAPHDANADMPEVEEEFYKLVGIEGMGSTAAPAAEEAAE
jgi:dynein intermediate chain 2